MAAVKPELYSEVSLLRDFPEEGLLAGDVAVLVDIVENEAGEAGAVLEIFNAVGDSIAVSSVPLSAISQCVSS